RGLDVAGVDEQIEVLGVPRDTRVALERVGATDEERDAPRFEPGHHVAVEVARDGIDHRGLQGHRLVSAGASASLVTGISSRRNPGPSGNSRFSTGSATL